MHHNRDAGAVECGEMSESLPVVSKVRVLIQLPHHHRDNLCTSRSSETARTCMRTSIMLMPSHPRIMGQLSCKFVFELLVFGAKGTFGVRGFSSDS